MRLHSLTAQLRQSLGILHKQDIQMAARQLGVSPTTIRPGDDCAAIPDGSGYLLLAAEGILPSFLEVDPWFAGWCAIMVNVSDIYAMGGYPVAVVDTLWSRTSDESQPIWQGMQDAASTYAVPIVGGHTNHHSPYTALSVAILGRANRLITSFDAQPGDRLLMVFDPRGKSHSRYPFWNAATTADPQRLRHDLALLPALAEANLCRVGKDISMGGVIGTVLMLMETSGCGATLHLDQIPVPDGLSLESWLLYFPSYGFLLSVHPDHVDTVQSQFRRRDLVCQPIGNVWGDRQVILQTEHDAAVFWDFEGDRLTGFSSTRPAS